MARPPITAVSENLFRKQLNAALDYLETEIAGAALADGDKGDITVSASGATWNIDASAVGTTEIAATAVTLAKLASDVTDRLYTQSSSVATTSGSTADVTGIPTTALEIKVHLLGVSLSGTDDLLVQFLDSGGTAITSGYNSSGHGIAGAAVGSSTSTAGFVMRVGAAANTSFLTLNLNRVSGSTTWVGSHTGNRGTAGMVGGGSIAVGGTVTGVRVTRTGADTLDAGEFFAEWRS